jgi:hypothetical protein
MAPHYCVNEVTESQEEPMTTKPGSDERLREALETRKFTEFMGETFSSREDCQKAMNCVNRANADCNARMEAAGREAALADSPGPNLNDRDRAHRFLFAQIVDPNLLSDWMKRDIERLANEFAVVRESAAPAPSSVGQTRVEESAMASASDDYDWTAACLHLLMCGKDPSCKRCREIEAHIKATGGDSHD